VLRKVTLKNFKAYGPIGATFELAPITLILGPNSVGKSTLFQALMVFKQTWEKELSGIGSLECVGPYVDLGAYSNAINSLGASEDDPKERALEIAIDWATGSTSAASPPDAQKDLEKYLPACTGMDGDADADQVPSRDSITKPKFSQPEHTSRYGLRTAIFGWIGERQADPESRSVRPRENTLLFVAEGVSSDSTVSMKAEVSEVGGVSLTFGHRLMQSDADHEDKSIHAPVEYDAQSVAHEISFEPGNRALDVHNPLASEEDATSVNQRLGRLLGLRNKLGETVHIGPLRHVGSRLYHPGVPGDSFVGFDGRDFVAVLTRDPNLVDVRLPRLNDAMRAIGIEYELRLDRVATKTRFAYELLLTPTPGTDKDHSVGLPDVGFGIGQILPILTQYTSDWAESPVSEHGTGTPARTILIEQPELHLHPLWQANLIRYFSQSLQAARVEGNGVPPQVIMETHSELMVIQVLEMVKRKVIRPDDVSIIFIEPHPNTGPSPKRIRIREDGRELDVWPRGFFPERHLVRSREQ